MCDPFWICDLLSISGLGDDIFSFNAALLELKHNCSWQMVYFLMQHCAELCLSHLCKGFEKYKGSYQTF